MPKENDFLEGPQDQGGKHGGQAGMPKHSPTAADQGIARDERRQEQPRNKESAASQPSRRGERSPGRKAVSKESPGRSGVGRPINKPAGSRQRIFLAR